MRVDIETCFSHAWRAAMREAEQKRLWKAFLYVVKHGQARKRPRLARGH